MIAVFDIHRQNKQIGQEIDAAIKRVIDSGIFILGKEVAAFEQEFAQYIGVKYAVGVASGTDAITLALLSIGIGLGDEVIVPANSYPSVFGISSSGAIPRLVDVDPATYTLDTLQIEKAITSKVKAILAVAMYGQSADMERILKIAKKHNLAVIEDCAQAHGAEIKIDNSKQITVNKKPTTHSIQPTTTFWKKVGSIGDVGCFSFYPTKNLGCFGDGGMVVTNNEEIAKKVRLLRMYGEESRYHSVVVGRNSRLDEMQAAILRVKLKHLDRWNDLRRKLACLYFNHILSGSCHSGLACRQAGIPSASWRIASRAKSLPLTNPSSIKPGEAPLGNPSFESPAVNFKLPIEAEYAKHIYHLFVIRSKHRDQLKKYLLEKGIATAIHYPTSIHTAPSYAFLGYKKGDFPQAEKISNEVLSLPMFPELKDEEAEEVCSIIRDFWGNP